MMCSAGLFPDKYFSLLFYQNTLLFLLTTVIRVGTELL